MALVLSIAGIAFAVFCVWLTVRIVNRGERWAKWVLAGALILPPLYLLSYGPAHWLRGLGLIPVTTFDAAAKVLYAPLVWWRDAMGAIPKWFEAYVLWWIDFSG